MIGAVKTKKHSKTLYLREDEFEIWAKAARLIPFYLHMSVSEFCTAAICKAVEELEKKELTIPRVNKGRKR